MHHVNLILLTAFMEQILQITVDLIIDDLTRQRTKLSVCTTQKSI